MKGFDAEKAHQLYDVPDQIEVVTALALGFPADAASLPEGLKARDLAERTRKPISKFVFEGEWGHPAGLK